jgi:arylsulfatase A-like enzyme
MATKGKQPDILVIWGDDVGWQNVSAYGFDTMGYTTPNIDRIGNPTATCCRRCPGSPARWAS